MRKHAGFTLIELMVVLAIAIILIALAAPSFVTFIRKTNITGAVNTFMADARFARSEAVRLGGSVVMCRSDAPEAANPGCGSGSTLGWESGWIIFQDLNNSGTKNAADPLLRVQAALTAPDSIAEKASSGSTKLVFTPTGRLKNLGSALTLQFGGNDYSNDLQRIVCVNVGGRVRISLDANGIANGNASCP